MPPPQARIKSPLNCGAAGQLCCGVAVKMVRILPFLVVAVSWVAVAGQQDCRDLPPLRINPRECCRQPKLIDDGVFAECFQRFGLRNRNSRQPSRVTRRTPPGFPSTCVAECVFNSTNLSVDNPDSISDLITQSLGDAQEWTPIFAEGFAACSKIVAEKLQQNNVGQKSARQFEGCSPLPGAILTCLHSHVFSRCPQTAWKNVPGCDQLRDFFTACPFPPMF